MVVSLAGTRPMSFSRGKMHKKLPPLIGLTGVAGSGKDTAAITLVNLGYVCIAYASALKKEVNEALNADYGVSIPDAMYDLVRELKGQDAWTKPTSPSMRRLLQYWGTEYRRGQDDQYWLKRLEQTTKNLHGFNQVVTDVRFAIEADHVRSLGGLIWRVTGRAAEGVPTHVSEQEGSAIVADATIVNDGSLEDLDRAVKAAIIAWREKDDQVQAQESN